MSDKPPTQTPALDDAELRRILSRHSIDASGPAMSEMRHYAELALKSLTDEPSSGDAGHQEAIRQARAEGMKAGIELSEKAFRIHFAAQQRQRQHQQEMPPAQRYGLIDYLCGIPLIDRIMGIK